MSYVKEECEARTECQYIWRKKTKTNSGMSHASGERKLHCKKACKEKTISTLSHFENRCDIISGNCISHVMQTCLKRHIFWFAEKYLRATIMKDAVKMLGHR